MRLATTRSFLASTSFAIGVALLSACAAAGTTDTTDTTATTGTGIAGAWSTPDGAQTSLRLQLANAGSSLSGAGILTVPPITPISGPATPAYTGDSLTITTGTFNTPDVSFTATLGANPDGSGGFYHGTLSFSGTLSGSTLSGTVTFTPPRTASQTFTAQTASGLTLSRK